MSQRLFVALLPPRAVLDELDAVVALLRDEEPALRWTPTEAWHVTLAFLGAVEQPPVDELAGRLARVALAHGPFRLAVAGAGRFGEQVLWAGVTGNAEPLRRLADSARAAAQLCGVEVETRPYRGHITLARGAAGVDLRPLVERLRAFAGPPWTATDLHLVESRLGAGPGRTALHQTYARWPLRQPR